MSTPSTQSLQQLSDAQWTARTIADDALRGSARRSARLPPGVTHHGRRAASSANRATLRPAWVQRPCWGAAFRRSLARERSPASGAAFSAFVERFPIEVDEAGLGHSRGNVFEAIDVDQANAPPWRLIDHGDEYTAAATAQEGG